MSGSEQRFAANRINAQKSTGPCSLEGNRISSGNAARHGLLSARMFLDDEDPDEFADLLCDLQGALAPVGAMELALVVRIAVTQWRQRRFVTAESAAITLARQAKKIAGGVSDVLGLKYGSALKEEDMQPFDPDRIAWCTATISEIEALDQIDLDSLPKLAPNVFEQLEADADGEGLSAYLAGYENGLTGYVDALMDWCRSELSEAERRPHVQALAAQVRAKHLLLPDDTLQVIARYQTTLDNQLYKALKALREAQEWRLETLDVRAEVTEEVQADAA